MDSSTIERLLDQWRREPTIAENIAYWHEDAGQPAQYEPFPEELHPAVHQALEVEGKRALYSHQLASWRTVTAGQNVVISTGTASGKTLCYTLPVLDTAVKDSNATAIFLFPTKALTQDQYTNLVNFEHAIKASQGAEKVNLATAIFDGDTSSSQRSQVRAKTRLLLTNPDMLHLGVLPHHTLWAEFLKNLRFVIIDEVHVYRGVFGSHIANVIRRLKRVAAFYGAHPQFILTSATIANPKALSERMIESPVQVVEQDGAPHGARHFLLYNPPITDPDLGIRRSAMNEGIRLAGDLLAYRVQTILFGRARRTIEFALRYLQEKENLPKDQLRAYRGGYLPSERREIERGLRSGSVRAVVATNALELGIDIGSMEASLMIGYPGTIAATRQQAGRAGRRQGGALAVLVASSSPIDQFLMRHPEYLLSRNAENALINPDNLLILLHHFRCAAFELPFKQGEHFGNAPVELTNSLLEYMQSSGELHQSANRFFWTADKYPASQISLRNTSGQPIVLQAVRDGRQSTIGEVDYESALWMAHPDAIYLHEGESYHVEQLDLEKRLAVLTPAMVDYFTEPKKRVEINAVITTKEQAVIGGIIRWGEIDVITRVTGFRRVQWFTHENLGESPLELPASNLRTAAYWVSLSQTTIDRLREQGLWNSSPNIYGPTWKTQRNLARQRDRFTCQVCGALENGQEHHVHHKTPFRGFTNSLAANALDNLVTLCPICHKRAELSVKIQSGLAGLSNVLGQLAPLTLMCDIADLGVASDPQSSLGDDQPTVVIYDQAPAGIGLSETLFETHSLLMQQAYELVRSCACKDGCPSCVGPGGENGLSGKQETLAILAALNDKIIVAE